MPGGLLSVPLGALGRFNQLTDFDMTGGDDVWFARLQLFFSCSLCPTGQMEDKVSHVEVSLVFFNTFEPISHIPDRCMQRNGIPPNFQHSMSTRWKQCPGDAVLPQRDLHNTISHSLRHAVPVGAAADSRPDSGTGSRFSEVNIWVWRCARAFPRKISVEDAGEMLRKRVQEARQNGAETLNHRKLVALARQAE